MERLKRRTDFQAAAKGARAPASNFVLQARSRGDEGACRIGFTVSRQVGKAGGRRSTLRFPTWWGNSPRRCAGFTRLVPLPRPHYIGRARRAVPAKTPPT